MTPDQKAADDLWRDLVIRASCGWCARCGYAGPLDAAHIIARSQSARLRCNPDNGRALCRECHMDQELHVWDWPVLIGQPEYDRLYGLRFFPGHDMPAGWWKAQRARLKALT